MERFGFRFRWVCDYLTPTHTDSNWGLSERLKVATKHFLAGFILGLILGAIIIGFM